MTHLNTDPKERIIREASILFAKKGFSGVGIREIAKAAEVNISMISYYFGGKVGLLKSLHEEYFNSMREIFSEAHSIEGDIQSRFKIITKRMIEYIRANVDLCKVVHSEIHIEIPELLDYKIELIKQNIEYSKKRFAEDIEHATHKENMHKKIKEKYGEEEFKKKHEIFHAIISPAYIGMLFSHFMQKDFLTKLHNIDFDDEFYETYADIISSLFLKGISGITKDLLGDDSCL